MTDTTRRNLVAAVIITLAIQISIAVWWFPQKWRACQRLYNNLPAQIICLSSHA